MYTHFSSDSQLVLQYFKILSGSEMANSRNVVYVYLHSFRDSSRQLAANRATNYSSCTKTTLLSSVALAALSLPHNNDTEGSFSMLKTKQDDIPEQAYLPSAHLCRQKMNRQLLLPVSN
jgi:hypothetical protein